MLLQMTAKICIATKGLETVFISADSAAVWDTTRTDGRVRSNGNSNSNSSRRLGDSYVDLRDRRDLVGKIIIINKVSEFTVPVPVLKLHRAEARMASVLRVIVQW